MALALLLLTTGTPDHLRLVTGDALLLVSSGPPEPQQLLETPTLTRLRPIIGVEAAAQPAAPAPIFEITSPRDLRLPAPYSVDLRTPFAYVDVANVAEVPEVPPSAEIPIRQLLRPPVDGYAAPVDRPTVPFDPAQGVADLPLPVVAVRRLPSLADESMPPPAGPPSSALLPPGVTEYLPQANQPPARHPRAQEQQAPAQNVDPITPAAVTTGWGPSEDSVPSRARPRPWLEAFAQNIDPIDTPAYLASFWISYYPSGPFPKQGLRAALQQHLAEAPPIVEVLVQAGSWRGESPALLRAMKRLTAEAVVTPQDLTTLADAFGCLTLSQVAVTSPTLRAPVVTSAILADVTVTHPTLASLEVC